MCMNCNRIKKRWKTSISGARSTLDVIRLTLYQKYLAALIDNNTIIEKDLRKEFANAVSNIPNFGTESKETSRKIMMNLVKC